MAEPAQIDPLSRALGAIEGRLEGIDKRLDQMATAAEMRVVFRLLAGLYALVLIGFTSLAWLTTHH